MPQPKDPPEPAERPAGEPAVAAPPLLDTAVSVATDTGTEPPKPVPEIVIQTLAAIGTGVGVIGFVIFCGAAVIFIRLDSVGLPATESVARVPREVLVATGAQLLAPAALLALGTVALIYAYNLGSQTLAARALRRIELELRTNAEDVHTKLAAVQEAKKDNEAAIAAAGEALQAAVADLTSATSEEARSAVQLRLDAARQAYDVLDTDRRALAERLAPLVSEQRKVDRAQADELHMREHNRNVRIVLLAVLLVAFAFALAILFFGPIDSKQLALVLITTIVGALLALAAFIATQRFVWFGVVAFLSIGVVFGMAKFFATENDPKVAPAAVLRAGHQPAAGFLVADTGDVLLLAQASSATQEPRLLVMPRAEIDDLVLGGATDPARAQIVALRLLADLCAEHVADTRPPTHPTTVADTGAGSQLGRRATTATSADVQSVPLPSLCTAREIGQVKQTLHDAEAQRRDS